MPKYKVCFSGFAYVEADSEEEAEDTFYSDNCEFEEYEVDFVEEVDEFGVEW